MNRLTVPARWAAAASLWLMAAVWIVTIFGAAQPAVAADTSAPFWPTGTPSLVASQGAAFIRVGGAAGWSAATDTPSPFAGSYEVYRSTNAFTQATAGEYIGKMESSTTPRLLDDSDGIPGENYYYLVVAIDLAGNRSNTSAQGVKFLTTASSSTMPGSEVAHDSYGEDTNLCRDCHHTHGTPGPKLFRKSSEKLVCYTCHDGTGSIYDVQNGSTPQSVSDFGESTIGTSTKTSYHPVPNATKVLSGDSGMECSDCHIAHKSPATIPRLLSAAGPSGETSTNAFCWTCHGTNASANGYKMGGNHRTSYYNLAAHSAEKSLPLATWQPASGTKINCENCHKSHGASTARLTAVRLGSDQTEQNLCFGGSGSGSSGCHGTGASKNLYQYFDGSGEKSYHAIGGTSYDGLTGAKVECSSCHGPHTVQTGSDTKLTNPFNTKNLVTTTTAGWGGGNFRTYFCNTCHRSGGFPVASTSETTIVPYSVAFPTVGAFPFFPGWDKNGYYYGSGHWLQSYTAGYETVRDCTYCHDPHGTANARLAKWSEESTCLQCHQATKPTGVGNAKDIQSEMTSTVTVTTYLYGTRGGNTNFDRYDIAANSWAARGASTVNFADGTSLVWDGGDYIYATHGGSTTFRRFSISGNTWTARTAVTLAPGPGGSITLEGNYIYCIRGNGTLNTYRYDIGANTWSDAGMAELPAGILIDHGGDSAHIAGDDYIYTLRGAGTNMFYRYSISGNTWLARATTPANVGDTAAANGGGQLEWGGGTAYLWALRGYNATAARTEFWRYNITGGGANTWTVMNPITGSVSNGGALAWDGGTSLYAFRGGGLQALYQYSITTGLWSADLLATGRFNENAGAALTRAQETVTSGATSKHPIATASRHSDTETASNLGNSNRHSECVDCHDPHWTTRTGSVDATKALHPSFTSTIGAALYGAWGVEPTAWPAAWTTQTAYNLQRMDSTTTHMEYQVCFRCHTYYAYGTTPPTSPSGGFTETDLSKDFNINNTWLHSVTTTGKNDYVANSVNYSASLINGWTPTKRMTCTDCHANDTAPTASVAGGPHGSANTFILRAPWDADTGKGAAGNPGDANDLCFYCHAYTTYVTGGNSNTGFVRDGSTNEHVVGEHSGYGCMTCHSALPHGGNRVHMIGLISDPVPYRSVALSAFTDNDSRTYQPGTTNCTANGLAACSGEH